jgi:hypothetical protein
MDSFTPSTIFQVSDPLAVVQNKALFNRVHSIRNPVAHITSFSPGHYAQANHNTVLHLAFIDFVINCWICIQAQYLDESMFNVKTIKCSLYCPY